MAKGKEKLDWLSVRKAIAYFRRLWPFLKPQWPQLVLLLVGVGLFAGGYAVRVQVIKPVVEIAQESKPVNTEEAAPAEAPSGAIEKLQQEKAQAEGKMTGVIERLLPYAGLLFLGAILMAFGTFLKHYYTGYVQARTTINLQRAIVHNVLKQSMSFFNNQRKGALMSRMTSNAQSANRLVKVVIDGAVSQPITVVAVMTVLVMTSPLLSLVTFVVLPIVLVPVMLFARKIQKATRSKYKKMEATGNFFHQMLDGIRVVKSYRLEQEQRDEFERCSDQTFKHARKVARYKGSSRFGIEITYNTVMAGALFVVGVLFTTQWFADVGAQYLSHHT